MTRDRIDLAGVWRAQPDACDEGERAGWQQANFDVRLWREVEVPSTFADCAPGMDTYEGTVWYRRAFRVPEQWRGRRIALRFEGVNYHARVWVNGRPVGGHEDPFLPFELPIERVVRPGEENFLAVCVDNVRRAGEVPGLQRGWRTYGGILREVYLLAGDHLRIEDVAVTAEPVDGAGIARVEASIVNERAQAAGVTLRVRVHDGSGAAVVETTCGPASVPPGGSAVLLAELNVAAAQPWSPDSPTLYAASLQLSADGEPVEERSVRFGFRKIEATRDGLLLNGRPVFLTGFNRHEDSFRAGPCADLETARRDLERMKEAGANFVRLCHYPHHPGELDLCDEIGLLAMCEIPLYWWDGLAEGEANCRRKLEAARRQLETMVGRDRNHPSVIFWSVSNETEENRPEVAEGNARLVRLAKELDPSRLAVHVSCRWSGEPHFEADDVLCVNGYPSWGASRRGEQVRPEEATRFWREELERLHRRYPCKPILVTEFGYPCLEDTFGCALGEDRQAEAIEAEFAGMDAPYVCGAAVWCWADHPWPEEPFINCVTTSPFGVLTRRRRALKGFHTVRRLFRARQGMGEDKREAAAPGPGGHSIVMVRPHLNEIPEVPFPPGFRIRPMREGEAGLWTDVIRDAEPYFTISSELFYEQFGTDLPATRRRCYFVEDERGVAVATISAWYFRDFRGGDWGRVHWVATRPGFQRRGLMKAGLSHTLRRLAEWHDRAYLDTSTKRIPAIKLYLDFGFVPDLEAPGAREAWREVRSKLTHPALETLDL